MIETKWIKKGWGGEKIIVNNEKYCGKILYLMKGLKCSIHYHKIKEETFYIHSGKIIVYYTRDKSVENKSDSSIYNYLNKETLSRGDIFHVPTGMIHQMVALEDTELFEFSTQDFPEDSIRIIKGD